MAREIPIRNGVGTAKIRNPVAVALLGIVTLGIYSVVWWFLVNRELVRLGKARGTQDLGENPTLSVLAVVPGALLIVPSVLTVVGTCRRVRAAQRITGRHDLLTPWIAILLGLLITPALFGYMQAELNKVWEEESANVITGAPTTPLPDRVASAGAPATTAAAAQAPVASPSPGWYPDPAGQAGERYWSGEEWTQQTRS